MSGNRMSFGQFVDTVQEQIKSYLPEKYQEAEVRTTEFQKLNDTYVGMTVRQEEQMIAPNINLNAQYEQYIRTGDMDRIFHTIAEQVQLQPEIQTDWLRDYEKVKDRLFIRVSDAQANKDYLANLPHKTVDGLAVTYHIAMNGMEGANASVAITNHMIDEYGVTREQLHADALANAKEMLPARYTSMAAMMMGLAAEAGFNQDMMEEAPPGVPMLMVLTNDKGLNGAAAMFYPGQLDQVAEGFHSDFFVLPSSVHEVLILPDDKATDYRNLEMMVQQINEAEVSPQDRLSDHVYHYDAGEHVLEKAATYEHRMEMKSHLEQKAKNAEQTRQSSGERKSVLQRLSEKKAQVNVQPKKNAPHRAKGMDID